LRLDPGTTKNDEGRVVYLTDELKRLLAAQLERIEALQRRLGRIVPFLFPHLDGDELGRPRRDIRSAWRTACKLAGCSGMLPHDFRRTAVRNMVNAGVPERVAMMVTGHRSRAVFDRYHIVSPADLQDVARRLTGTFQGTLGGGRVYYAAAKCAILKAGGLASTGKAVDLKSTTGYPVSGFESPALRHFSITCANSLSEP
jgi:Phage integrase family